MNKSGSIKRINQMFEYIENELSAEREVEIDSIARILCENKLSAQRIFRFLTGCTLNEYIKKRKLCLAAMEIYVKHAKVIDLAVKYNYSSAQAFSRAFQKYFGFKPSEVLAEGFEFKLDVPFVLVEELDIKQFKFQIVTKDEFVLHSISKFAGYDVDKVGDVAKTMWQTFDKDLTAGEKFGFTEQNANGYFYHIASDVPFENSKPFVVKKCKWAVFTFDGDELSVKRSIGKIKEYCLLKGNLEGDLSMPRIERYLSNSFQILYPLRIR